MSGPRGESGDPTPEGPGVSFSGATATSAVQWNALAVAGRQGLTVLTAVVVARILGPESYGVISAATLYVTFTTLLLDQGLSSALIQRPHLSPRAPGAAATINILVGFVLAGLTWLVAPLVADFFDVERLTPVLRWLGLGLVVKSLAIAPRAMRARTLTFRPIAVADIAGAALGAAAGIGAALLGEGPESVVFQVVTTDAVVGALLLTSYRGPVPTLHLREGFALLPYGSRVMATNAIAYFSRNIDNILVGRVLGVVALSFYGMAYRVLAIPVQLLGQTIARVMFPAFSRMAHRRDLLGRALLTATGLLALLAVPAMSLLAVASHELVLLALGAPWLPAAPLVAVLALAGARETVFYVTGPLMKATGAVRLALRYELLATAVQVGGIVLGLQFGLLWVAVGYAGAGVALTPVLLVIQRRLAGVAIARQLAVLAPAVHVSLWGAAAYLLVRLGSLSSAWTLAVGALAYVAVAGAVLWLVHRSAARVGLGHLRRMLPGRAPMPGRTRSSEVSGP